MTHMSRDLGFMMIYVNQLLFSSDFICRSYEIIFILTSPWASRDAAFPAFPAKAVGPVERKDDVEMVELLGEAKLGCEC